MSQGLHSIFVSVSLRSTGLVVLSEGLHSIFVSVSLKSTGLVVMCQGLQSKLVSLASDWLQRSDDCAETISFISEYRTQALREEVLSLTVEYRTRSGSVSPQQNFSPYRAGYQEFLVQF